MKKPILLLDVDGVLNVPNRKVREVRLKHASGLPFYPNPRISRFMSLVWKLFDVRWLTAWDKAANAIARHYELDTRPVIRYHAHGSKAAGAAAALRDWKGPVAWVEDGIDDAAKALVAARRWTYFHCEPHVGVTGQHMKQLREFAVSAQAQVEK